MGSLFKGTPLFLILGGNLLVCAIGALFTFGAPNIPSKKQLKSYIVAFWCLLTLYYGTRLMAEIFSVALDVHVLPWLVLVIISDSAVLLLYLGCSRRTKRRFKYSDETIYASFIIAWVSAIFLGHNALSQIITTCAFIAVAWFIRYTDINNSLVVISYGFLSLPFLLIWEAPAVFGQSVFLLLLGAKMPLIGALYKVVTSKNY